jgi:hypothetical protein
MELVGIARMLWRRRIPLGLGVVVAVAVGVVAIHRVSIMPPELERRGADSALASARVLVDTPRSLVAAARPNGWDTIAARAALLGSLMGRDALRAEVARHAGVKMSELGVASAYLGAPGTATPLSRQAADLDRPTETHVLTVGVENPQVPIVSILAEAPTLGTAARLVEAARGALESLVNRPSANAQGVRMERLGALTVKRVTNGTGAAKAGIAALLVLALWWLAVILFDAIVRRRASASRLAERIQADGRAAVDL